MVAETAVPGATTPPDVGDRHPLLTHLGPWTWEDLHAFPRDGRRYEVVDGCLLVMPPASQNHWEVSAELLALLLRAAPAHLRVGPPAGVLVGSSYREPDLVVLRRASVRNGVRARQVRPFDPEAVVLAVEVESPSSRTNDRVVKRHEYADAGIRHYWRVVPDDGPLVVVHRLDEAAGRYRVVGQWRGDDELTLDDPFTVRFRPSQLVDADEDDVR